MKLWGDAGRRGARACSSRICRIKTLKAAFFTYKEGFGFASCGGPKVKIFSLFFSEAKGTLSV